MGLFDSYAEVTPATNMELLVNDPSDLSQGVDGTTKRITVGDLLSPASADIARIFVAGHSYASGYASVEGGERWPARLAASLHAEEVTYAVTSAVLAQDDGGGHPGGYAAVLNALTPRVASGAAYSPRNAAPYVALSPVCLLDYGYNDLAYLSSSVTTALAWFSMALTACCCIARSGGYFPDTDSSVAYGGSGGSHWTAQTSQQQYGSPTNHKTTTLNDTVTITVPADFPGGEVDILTIAYGGGAKWSTVTDGGTAQVLDGTSSAYGSGSGRGNLVVQRLAGLAAGAHTIVMTLTALDGSATAIFDSWLIAAPDTPAVVLLNHPLSPGLPYSSGGVHDPVTADDVTALNTAVAAVGASFASGVVIGDFAGAVASAGGDVAAGQPGSRFVSDGLHLNSAGSALAAQAAREAVLSAPLPEGARMAPTGIVMRQVGGPLEPAFHGSWSASGGWAWFGKDAAGAAWLQLKVTNGSSPSPGDTVLVLPPGYQPSVQVLVPGVSWRSGYTGLDPASFGIQSDGTVQWFGGDPATEIDVTWSWPANGLGSLWPSSTTRPGAGCSTRRAPRSPMSPAAASARRRPTSLTALAPRSSTARAARSLTAPGPAAARAAAAGAAPTPASCWTRPGSAWRTRRGPACSPSPALPAAGAGAERPARSRTSRSTPARNCSSPGHGPTSLSGWTTGRSASAAATRMSPPRSARRP